MISTRKAPVVVLVYNRPSETRQIMERVLASGPRRVFCVVDGPNLSSGEDAKLNEEVVRYLNTISQNSNVSINRSEINLGIARRMVSGLNWVFSQVDEAIILEDDCLPDQSFFQYCDELLAKYENNQSIGVVSGFNPIPSDLHLITESYAASKFPLTWGWATWKRVWNTFDPSAYQWRRGGRAPLSEIETLTPGQKRYWAFNLDRVTKRSDHQIWDYQFTFSQWVNNRVALIPRHSMVKNIGFTLSATHTKEPGHWLSKVDSREMVFPLKHPLDLTPLKGLDLALGSKLFSLGITRLVILTIATKIFSKKQLQALLQIRGRIKFAYSSVSKTLKVPRHKHNGDIKKST